ncbi:MAG: SDR family oxidoreductase [Actinobacteria bacterium]|nr:SDR family oxidoreductase [Actinomycetota bacterium]
MADLEGKTILVSGVGPGLGSETARIALREGAEVVAAARQIDRLRGICAELDPTGERIEAVQADILDPASCASLVDAVLARFGKLDGIVHVAALDAVFGTLEGADLDEWRRTYEMNVFGSMQLVQAAIPALKDGGGSVVFIGTQSSDLPRLPQFAYASSKGALRTLGRLLAVELGPSGVRVNNVIATWMWGPPVQMYVQFTAQDRGVDEQVVIDEIASNMALRVIPEDDDVAEMSCFLMSDRARMVTGQTIWVNAGEFIV